MINNTVFSNCNFENGIIEVDTDNDTNGYFQIDNSYFYNNTSINGAFLNIKNFYDDFNGNITIMNSKFENNTASNFGGVVYSNSPLTSKLVVFEQCEFLNNNAKSGIISFSKTKETGPTFSNIDTLSSIKGLFSTNPTKLKLNDDYNITIYSGEKIPEGMSCEIYDDYDNYSDFSNFDINNLISYSIENIDDYNIELFGQTKSYCWDNKCEFPPLKIVGNPGTYAVRLRIITFGKYLSFENNYIDLNFEIKTCNETFIHQNVESHRLKSCYEAKCTPKCNNGGKCININLCNCTETLHTGNFFNLGYSYLLTIERNSLTCYLQNIFNNTGFSIVFVTIVVKSLRIYKIFCYGKGTKRAMKNSTMYLIIFSYVSFHLIINIIWIICDKIKLSQGLTDDFKEYKKCTLPKTNIICFRGILTI
ncbi:hypothetical protein PIROE2DRAFT_14319 [Piromyces sp. E2]|nr:hypothetical protein PIROE2DRAFT_14319 [Piromyces sp. E2]|eukprot:OUM60025.1 hypothetical protein PIROE2DRAFT_14319 [Piromyces sp. E2]